MANKRLIIREICKDKGMNLKTLAGKIGIEPRSLSQALTRNKFSIERLNDIADALHVTIPELFEDANTITCPYCGKKIRIKV